MELLLGGQVAMQVWLEGSEMRLGELLRLQEGQIVRLDHPVERTAVCTLNGVSSFSGQIVSTGQRRAFQVEDVHSLTREARLEPGVPAAVLRRNARVAVVRAIPRLPIALPLSPFRAYWIGLPVWAPARPNSVRTPTPVCRPAFCRFATRPGFCLPLAQRHPFGPE